MTPATPEDPDQRKLSRRRIRWENVRGPKAVTALVVATALGAGLFPFAPGTMGSLVALPLAFASADWDCWARVLLWLALTAVGTWSAKVFDQTMGTSDNQNIVIDEVVGMGISTWTAGRNPWTLLAAFLLFRFFDVLKPPPVRQADQWSKKMASDRTRPSAAWWGGFGVILDDILAGFQALLVVLLLQHLNVLH